MKKKVTIEFVFDDEDFDLNAITYDYVLNILKESGLINEKSKPEWRIKIELIKNDDDEENTTLTDFEETIMSEATEITESKQKVDYEELYNRLATEMEKLELKRLKRHEKLQRLIHKRQHYKIYIT